MIFSKSKLKNLILCLMSYACAFMTNAHMLPAQHGTLNIVEGGAFMVLSLPVSAFSGIDDDNDGKLSMAEFDIHRKDMSTAIAAQIVLSDEQGKVPLQGMMLSPVVEHDAANAPVSQIIIMGRFKLSEVKSKLQYQIGLFGSRIEEKVFKITATRRADGKQQNFEITPKMSVFHLFNKG